MADGWTDREIEALADDRSFMRGVAYHRDGRVEVTERDADRIDAVVRGSLPYLVELRRSPRVEWSCSCPVGEDGAFCKHCVAVALETAGPKAPSNRRAPSARRDDEVDVRSYVAGLDDEVLVELVMEQVESDWRLRERLQARTLAAGGGSVDVREWKKRIDATFGGRQFVDYREAPAWAHDVFEVIDALDDLRSAGHAATVIGLVEHANRRADKAVQNIDDSDGWLTDIAGRLAELHLSACEQARPDPVELARRLADLELTGELDTFRRAAATYAEVLGPDGIAEYRRIVEPKWRAGTKNKDPYSHAAFASTQAMIGVAQGAGDPDELIAIRGGELRTPGDYLEIAEALIGAKRRDDALDWARRGLATYADRHWQTPPLREFLTAQLRAGGDDASAEELWWDGFDAHPSIDGYRRLLAESAEPDRRRAQAIELLRQRLDAGDTEARSRNPLLERPPATTLVEILLYEGSIDDAWTTANGHGCDKRTWMTLARAREATHPMDAIPIYERAVAEQIDTKKNGGYRAAVDLLARVRTLASTAGEPERFTDLLALVTTEHARKRNLIAFIDKMGWS